MCREAMAWLCAASIIFATDIQARSAVDQADADADRILRNHEQEREFKELQRELERDRRSLKRPDRDRQQQSSPPLGPCFDIRQIDVEGVSLLAEDEVARLKQPYLDRCLSLSSVNALAEAITNRYIDAGYITSRAYVPTQDLADGSLWLRVIEGHIEQIRLNNLDGSPPRSEIDFAFPDLAGEALNLRDLEQGLDQINRLESNQAELRLRPGETAGSSIVDVNNRVSKRWHAAFGVDNSGTESTGEPQGFLDLVYDNFLGINDSFYVRIKHDLENEPGQQSRGFYSRAEVPYGYWAFSYTFGWFDYESHLRTPFGDFQTTGLSRIHDLGLNRVLWRSGRSMTTALFNLVSKKNINQLEGFTLGVSSQKLTVLHLGLRHVQRLRRGFIYGLAGYERGLDWLGARAGRNSGPDTPQAQFNKTTADVGLVFDIDPGLQVPEPRLNLNGRVQWSDVPLFGTEQLSLGGPYSIRGFKDRSIGGSTGAFLRSDLSIVLPPSGLEVLDRFVGRLRPFVAFDIGAIRSGADSADRGGTLKSYSLGFRNEYGEVVVEFTYSRTVSAPAFVVAGDDQLFLSAALTL